MESHFVSCRHDEWLLNLVIDDQENLEIVAHATLKNPGQDVIPETSATFHAIILSLRLFGVLVSKTNSFCTSDHFFFALIC